MARETVVAEARYARLPGDPSAAEFAVSVAERVAGQRPCEPAALQARVPRRRRRHRAHRRRDAGDQRQDAAPRPQGRLHRHARAPTCAACLLLEKAIDTGPGGPAPWRRATPRRSGSLIRWSGGRLGPKAHDPTFSRVAARTLLTCAKAHFERNAPRPPGRARERDETVGCPPPFPARERKKRRRRVAGNGILKASAGLWSCPVWKAIRSGLRHLAARRTRSLPLKLNLPRARPK